MTVSPIAFFGGKQRLASKIVRLLPPHRIYVEAFGGGGSVLFAKAPAYLDVYNDIDDGLVNFFTVLRDQSEALQEKLRLTPYARSEYLHCRRTWKKEKDPLERARRWFFTICVSFDSGGRTTGWKAGTVINHPEQFANRVEGLWHFADRMRRVQIDKRDWPDCIALYDSEDTVFYCDPPYLPSTRKKSGGEYNYELSYNEHRKLLETLLNVKGSVLVSGYDSRMYRDALEPDGFERYEYDLSLQANLQVASLRDRRLEIIWRKAKSELRLFDTLP